MEDLLNSLVDSGIFFTFIRPHELFDASIGDIDIYVSSSDKQRFKDHIYSYLANSKTMSLFIERGDLFHTMMYFYDSREKQFYLIDLQTKLSDRGVVYLPESLIKKNVVFVNGLPFLNRQMQLLQLLLHSIMDKERVAPKYLDYLTRELDSEDNMTRLIELFKSYPYYTNVKDDLDVLIRNIKNGSYVSDLANLRALHKKLRKAILVHSPLQVINRIHYSFVNLKNKLLYSLHPPGKYISLIGPDGCGKTTTANELIRLLEERFVSLEHHAPHVFYVYQGSSLHVLPSTKFLGKIFERLDSRDATVEAKGNRAATDKDLTLNLLVTLRKIKRLLIPDSLFKTLMAVNYALDRVASYVILVLPKVRRGNVVVSDRTAFDLFNWFNIKPDSWLAKVLLMLIPKGNRIILLFNTPEIIRERKAELPVETIKRELETFLYINEVLSNMSIVKTNKPPADVAEEIVKNI